MFSNFAVYENGQTTNDNSSAGKAVLLRLTLDLDGLERVVTSGADYTAIGYSQTGYSSLPLFAGSFSIGGGPPVDIQPFEFRDLDFRATDRVGGDLLLISAEASDRLPMGMPATPRVSNLHLNLYELGTPNPQGLFDLTGNESAEDLLASDLTGIRGRGQFISGPFDCPGDAGICSYDFLISYSFEVTSMTRTVAPGASAGRVVVLQFRMCGARVRAKAKSGLRAESRSHTPAGRGTVETERLSRNACTS